MSFPNTLTIFINTRIRGYPKIKYVPEMTVPNIKSETVYFNPLVKLSKSAVYNIPPGYPPSERYTQFFSKNDFNSLVNRSVASGFQRRLNLNQATEAGIVDNNINVTLDALFRKNTNFYIHGQPYTIYAHEWVNGDWQIDTKSFEKNIQSSIYGQGLYGYQQNLAAQNQIANEELKKFRSEHGDIMQGFAVSTDISKFKDDYKSSVAKGVKTPEDVAAEEEYTKENVPKVARNLASKRLVFQSIINLDDEANLSSDPVSLNILYSINRDYREDILLNRKVLEPLYNNLLEKGEQFRIAKDNFDAAVGIYTAVAGSSKTTPIATPVATPVESPLEDSESKTPSAPTAVVTTNPIQAAPINNVFKNKKNYDDAVDEINKIITDFKSGGLDFKNILKNNDTRKQLLKVIVILEKYKKQFYENFFESLKLLAKKIRAQIDYIKALSEFYSNLYVAKENQYKSQNSEKNHQNILMLNLIKFDMQCYKTILKNFMPFADKPLIKNYDDLIIFIRQVQSFINRENSTPTNYADLLRLYYDYPGILKINRYQFDICMFSLLKFDQIFDMTLWKILYNQTSNFLENIKENIIGKNSEIGVIEGKLSIARKLQSQYDEKYTQQQRDSFSRNLKRLKKPLDKQKSSIIDFAFPKTKELKEQTNDYIRLQTAILLCYDLITIYSKISAIKYSREISLLTSKQNLSNILNKIYERKIDIYQQILQDTTMIPHMPDFFGLDRASYSDGIVLNENLKRFQNYKSSVKNDLAAFKRAMKILKKKYHDAVDILIPHLSKLGIQEKCRQLVEDNDDESDIENLFDNDDTPMTPSEKIKKIILTNNETFADAANTETLQENIIYLYEDAIRERLTPNLSEDEKNDIIESWKVIDNRGGGDCLFLAIAGIFNNELINNGSIANNPFAYDYYTNETLRLAVAHGITNDEIDRWDVHRRIENIDESDPRTTDDDKEYKQQYAFLLDERGRWIGNDYTAVRNAIRTRGRYWGDQTAIIILERIFRIKFIIIDTTINPGPIPLGIYVSFQDDDGEMVFGVVKERTTIGGQDIYRIESNDLIDYPNITVARNHIAIAESGHYKISDSMGNIDIANEFTHYAFILLTEDPISKVLHYEIITSAINNKFIYTVREIPPFFMYLIFQSQWKFLTDVARDAGWFGNNNEFREVLEHYFEEYNASKQLSRTRTLSSRTPPPRIRAKFRAKQKLKKPKKGGGKYNDGKYNDGKYNDDDEYDMMIGGAISSRNRYVDINRPYSSMNDSKLSYYIIIDLELYPGKSIPLLKQPVISCNLRYEKIRQAFADMFGLEYQPLDFYQRGHVAPSSIKYRKTEEDKDKDKKYGNRPNYYNRNTKGNYAYDTRRHVPYYGGEKNKTRRLIMG